MGEGGPDGGQAVQGLLCGVQLEAGLVGPEAGLGWRQDWGDGDAQASTDKDSPPCHSS